MPGGTTRILLTFVGNRDPYSNEEEQLPGPILSLLEVRPFDRVYLICTGPAYTERARTIEEMHTSVDSETQFSFISLELSSPVDYEEIFSKLKKALDTIIPSLQTPTSELSILADSGTPQMQTSWFLFAKSGYLDARLLQGIPPQFADGAYKVKEIDLDTPFFPKIQFDWADASPEAVTEPNTIKEGKNTAGGVVTRGNWITVGSLRILGTSPVFKNTIDTAVRVAKYEDMSVLILGETGTGKEVIARLIHERSPRADKPFLPVNCSSISSSLAESELFGFGKGAFTGASKERLGIFRAADGGTVFLDEIGDMPIEVQPKLLRALEMKKILPIGFDKEVAVDVRVLAATNHYMEALIGQGRFRRDLYERLRHVTITVPPLRERKEDIPLLAYEFLDRWNRKYHENKRFSEGLLRYISVYHWPANVRGLQNSIKQACALSTSDTISVDLLPVELRNCGDDDTAVSDLFDGDLSSSGSNRRSGSSVVGLGKNPLMPEDGINIKAYLYQIEKALYHLALARTGGNREQAARLLGLNPPAFRKALRERFSGLE